MKKLGILFLVVFASFQLAPAAMNVQGKPLYFEVAPTIALPIGDWSDAAGFGIGAVGGANWVYRPNMTITGRTGYIYFTGDEVGGFDYSYYMIPLVGGLRYFISPNLYTGGEAGVTIVGVNIDGGAFGNVDGSSTELTLAPWIGYMMMMGSTAIDLSAQFALISDASMIAARAGFTFGR